MRPALIVAVFCAALALAANAAHAENVTLEYQLTIDHPESGVGRVEMTISALESKGFRLLRSSDAGPGWFDAVKAFNPSAPDKPYEIAPISGGWYITTDGARSVAITYTIKPGELGRYGHLGLITSDYAALDGSFIFLAPGDEQTIKDVAFKFAVPPSWQSILSWKESQGAWHPDSSFAPISQQLARSLICFGAFTDTKKAVGTNTLVVHTLLSYPKPDADALAAMLANVYTEIYNSLVFETGRSYDVVCLPPAPDGMPTVAGAWADGQALTLAGTFDPDVVTRCVELFGRFVMSGYFADAPYGVNLKGDDLWLYPAVLTYAEGIAAVKSEKMDENFFYGQLYATYADEASRDVSQLDIPFTKQDSASDDAKAFLRNYKAPILLMRLDFEIRNSTNNSANVVAFLKALYKKGHNWAAPADVLGTLVALTNTDFTAFYDTFIRDRSLILPTWPAFLDMISSQKAEPGPVVAEVDGAPIYEREVQLANDAILSQGHSVALTAANARETTNEERQAAIQMLVDEKLMDEALASHKLNVVPEAFWRLRLVLPPKVMELLIARKRQTLKDVLYSDWLNDSHKQAKVTVTRPDAPAPPAFSRQSQQPSQGLSLDNNAPPAKQ